MEKRQSRLDAFLQFFSSVKLGLVLLALVGTATIVGTLVMQRPMAQEGQIEQVYAPQTIKILEFLGLFDVFHAWWFVLLLALLGANIALSSLDHLPQAWRIFSGTDLTPDEAFIRGLPFSREVPAGSGAKKEVLAHAAKSLQGFGYRARLQALEAGILFAQRHRWARLAPYVVHASLLIIFAGGIVDGVSGYRGYMQLTPGMSARTVEPLSVNGTPQELPFALRCESAGMETYPDGSPRQYWSWLVVEEDGRQVLRKQIFVNDPLTYRGIRFFQSNFGSSGEPAKLVLEATWPASNAATTFFELKPGAAVPLDDKGTKVTLGDFIPDFELRGNQLVTRSNEPKNPALRLVVMKPNESPTSAWILPKSPELAPPNNTGINFKVAKLEMRYFTGLQVAKQPGQGLIWGGSLLLVAGLMLAFYLSHTRIWGIVTQKSNQNILLLGGDASKYREGFAVRFQHIAETLEKTFSQPSVTAEQREQVAVS